MAIDPDTLPYRPCAGVVLMNRDGLIFAGRRLDTTADAWQMPQGGIDAGEQPLDAAFRELWEETGVNSGLVEYVGETPGWLTYDLPPELMGKVWKGRYRGQQQRWFLFRFLGQDNQIRIDSDHPEFSEWRWIDADDMVRGIVSFKRPVYEQVVAAFRNHLA